MRKSVRDCSILALPRCLDSAEPDDAGQQTELRRFTPQYASPEQVTGGRITTAADVYSLGLVLYELLAGVPPYQVTSGASDRERQLICETVPLLPSRALKDSSGLAETRGLNTVRRLDSDLDTIVMKAIRKEPERRYPSATRFSRTLFATDNICRSLRAPDTVGYRLRKFVRRNRVPVVISSIASLLLIIATVLSINFALHANQQAAIASAVVDFLTDGCNWAVPIRMTNRIVTSCCALYSMMPPLHRRTLRRGAGNSSNNSGNAGQCVLRPRRIFYCPRSLPDGARTT